MDWTMFRLDASVDTAEYALYTAS